LLWFILSLAVNKQEHKKILLREREKEREKERRRKRINYFLSLTFQLFCSFLLISPSVGCSLHTIIGKKATGETTGSITFKDFLHP
jgi:hypothetical protein